MKNQSYPPCGKPQSISGWRGYIPGSGLFHTPSLFCVGYSATKSCVNSPLSLPHKLISANTERNVRIIRVNAVN